MRSTEKGMRMYVVLLNTLSIASRGLCSDKMMNAIITTGVSLTKRVTDIENMLDQTVLINR